MPLQRDTLDGTCWTGAREKSLGQEGFGRGTACLLPCPDVYVWQALFFSRIPWLLSDSQTHSSWKSFRESSSGLPHATLKHVPNRCPPRAFALPEAPTLSRSQLCCSQLGSWFRQKNLCSGSGKDVSLLLLRTPLPGWIHLSFTGMMTMACSLVPRFPASPPSGLPLPTPLPLWLPEQESLHAFPCSHLPSSSRNGVQAPWPGHQASRQLSVPACLRSPSHLACHSKFSRSLHRLSFELRIPPLALPGRLAFSPRPQAGV